jgi:hypothetical protein
MYSLRSILAVLIMIWNEGVPLSSYASSNLLAFPSDQNYIKKIELSCIRDIILSEFHFLPCSCTFVTHFTPFSRTFMEMSQLGDLKHGFNLVLLFACFC